MKTLRLRSALVLLILATCLAHAQASRTWVSGVGSDSNPCTRALPCQTLTGALSKTAANGEIDAIDAADFGAVTINKAISIDGGGGTVASVFGAGVIAQAGPSDVVILRNLRINGNNSATNGIRFLSGKSLHIENSTIAGFTSNGIDVEKGDGGNVYIWKTILEANGLCGLFVHNTASNVAVAVTNSISKGNQFGIAAQDFSRVSVFDSEISGNTNTGLQSAATTSGSTAILDVYDSVLTHNGIGLYAGGIGISTVNIAGLSSFDNISAMITGQNGTINSFHNNSNTGTGSPGGPPMNVLTNHYDSMRSGQNTQETVLNPTNVSSGKFAKLFTQAVDGFIYAQPLYVADVAIAGVTRNVVFVATDGGSVYAFDADSNQLVNGNPYLWKTTISTPGPLGGGIKSTPVIDLNTNTMYVEAKSLESGIYVHRLHALNIITGQETLQSPVVISGAAPGSGDGGSFDTFNPANQMSRPALLLFNGLVYVAFASNGGDFSNGQYYGWIFTYDATTLARTGIINTAPNGPTISNGGAGAGIWMAGNGPAADSNGNVFMVTGNGAFDTTLSPSGFPSLGDYGDSIVKVSIVNGTPVISDYFSPWNTTTLNSADLDLGSGGLLLLPDQPGNHPHLLVQAGKGGSLGQGPAPFAAIHLIDRDSMGKFCNGCNNPPDPNIVQELPGAVGGVWAAPVYWNNNVYFWGSADTLKAFALSNGLLIAAPVGHSTNTYNLAANLSISANGTTNGIVWAVQTDSSPAILNAYAATPDANGILDALYSSANNSGDNAGSNPHFIVATIARGKAYLGTNQLNVYGLISGAGQQ